MSNPFLSLKTRSGQGSISLSDVSTQSPVLSYQYPLKLIAPSTVFVPANPEVPIHTVFLLTYGGGIVAADCIGLSITLPPSSRLLLLTQGSTKVFKTPCANIVSRQDLCVQIGPGAALCYLPDPVQPFAESAYEQTQMFELMGVEALDEYIGANLCVCDWMSEGRTARGERWDFWRYCSKTEVFATVANVKQRLLLRDNVVLDRGQDNASEESLASRMDELGVYGTLFLRGPMFKGLADFFMTEFTSLPRIGARNWDDADQRSLSPDEAWSASRQAQERANGVLWTASSVRGFGLVKFGAKQVEGARVWLRDMLIREGSVEQQFGEKALLCLR